MYSSVLMNAAHIQAEPLNGYATCIQYYITEYSPQVLRKRDESVTKTMHGPRGRFHGTDQHSGQNPAGVDLTNPQDSILAGVGFENLWN